MFFHWLHKRRNNRKAEQPRPILFYLLDDKENP